LDPKGLLAFRVFLTARQELNSAGKSLATALQSLTQAELEAGFFLPQQEKK
jgi:hypothetical protein